MALGIRYLTFGHLDPSGKAWTGSDPGVLLLANALVRRRQKPGVCRAHRVQLECHYGSKPYMVWYLGPNSIMALQLDPCGRLL